MTREEQIGAAYRNHLRTVGNPTNGFEYGARWADENPSDETIMRVLNCIGYEERSWIQTVRENWDKCKED